MKLVYSALHTFFAKLQRGSHLYSLANM